MRRAFTLVEMLVVVGILSILVTVLLVAMSGSHESAAAAKCLTNMKNLSTAALNYAMETGWYPASSSGESMLATFSKGSAKTTYSEIKGWVSSDTQGRYPASSSMREGIQPIGMFEPDSDKRLFALTNGALWARMSGNSTSYVCPNHRKHGNAHWSYLMNPNVGRCKYGENFSFTRDNGDKKSVGAERVLLFSEVPFQPYSPGEWFPDESKSLEEQDGVLQYEGSTKETLGSNHKHGKLWMAHVSFADGHVEKIRTSTSQGGVITTPNLENLTKWLCEGEDVIQDRRSNEYKRID